MLPMCIAYAYELAIGLGSVCNKNGFRPVGYDTAFGVVEGLKKEEIFLFPGALQNMTAVCEEKHLVIQTHCICHIPEYGDRYILVTYDTHI